MKDTIESFTVLNSIYNIVRTEAAPASFKIMEDIVSNASIGDCTLWNTHVRVLTLPYRFLLLVGDHVPISQVRRQLL